MTYTVEVLLRDTDQVISETVTRGESSPDDWTDLDVTGVLEGMLQAIARARDPDIPEPDVVLRGLSWIVDDAPSGVVIAIEIPSGAVVAGPFAIPQDKLSSIIDRVIARASSGDQVVH
jgi:hypothetical protein